MPDRHSAEATPVFVTCSRQPYESTWTRRKIYFRHKRDASSKQFHNRAHAGGRNSANVYSATCEQSSHRLRLAKFLKPFSPGDVRNRLRPGSFSDCQRRWPWHRPKAPKIRAPNIFPGRIGETVWNLRPSISRGKVRLFTGVGRHKLVWLPVSHPNTGSGISQDPEYLKRQGSPGSVVRTAREHAGTSSFSGRGCLTDVLGSRHHPESLNDPRTGTS
jgi:hypothetical protein